MQGIKLTLSVIEDDDSQSLGRDYMIPTSQILYCDVRKTVLRLFAEEVEKFWRSVVMMGKVDEWGPNP